MGSTGAQLHTTRELPESVLSVAVGRIFLGRINLPETGYI
jgi:hypothetical protein